MLKYEPQTSREPSSKEEGRQLSDQLKEKMKRTSQKLQVILYSSSSPGYLCANWWRISMYNFRQSALSTFENASRRTLKKMKSLYKDYRPKRVIGFKCDLKKCDSTLMECSATACKKESMIFDVRAHPCDLETTDSSASDISTTPSVNGQDDKS